MEVSTSSNVDPDSAWKIASDLHRFDDWMTIFGGGAGRCRRRSTRASASRH
ncbi:hypothetical protein BZL30_5081 [Mycobacterium kansasii]|uniref:Polyketide cyclase / dehydrase and lipid transport family protein n=1 Tax=Mycobacterium kansasii TaxID=1768 RepID=A0A1V3X4N6_MYCKA|nr:hypothetical protein BZL30_5081 [Mycobacterium kansasii]